MLGLKRLKVKRYSFPEQVMSELRGVTCHIGSHSVTCHPTQLNTPHLTSARGWCLIYLPRRDGRLSWPRWPVTYQECLPAHRRSPIPVLTHGQESNSGPVDHKSDALTTTPPSLLGCTYICMDVCTGERGWFRVGTGQLQAGAGLTHEPASRSQCYLLTYFVQSVTSVLTATTVLIIVINQSVYWVTVGT